MKLVCINFRLAIVIALCLTGSLVIAAPAFSAGKFKLKAGAQGEICLK